MPDSISKKSEALRRQVVLTNSRHPWEWFGKENINGLMRQCLPKTKRMAALAEQQCDPIAAQLNQRPGKITNYMARE